MRLSTVNVAGWTLDKRQRFVFGAVQVMMLVGILPASLRATSPPRACPSKDRIYVVNIIPESLSGETGYDSEPNVAVNPINPAEIAASAFTREPMGGKTAPIFVSTDGGKIWSCRSIVPSPQITCDITL